MSSLNEYIISDKFIKDNLNLISQEAANFYIKQKNYENFITSQKPGFLKLMNYINKLLYHYKISGDISEFVQFRARIKAPSSAFKNDNKKALDDVFGMELICATQEEIDFLVNQFLVNQNANEYIEKNTQSTDKNSNFLKILRYKFHDKDNGYKAQHYSLCLDYKKLNLLYSDHELPKDPEKLEELLSKIPLVEFQFKTIEVATKSSIGSAAHSTYKNVNPKEIQADFNNFKLQRGNTLPYMWVSSNSANKPFMKELNDDEVAKKLYPFLNIDRQKTIS